MDHLELMSQLDHIGVEAASAYNEVARSYDNWSVGMSPATKDQLHSQIDTIESCCRNVRELLR